LIKVKKKMDNIDVYVKDALNVWSENMLLFHPIHWTRKIKVVDKKYYCKFDEYIHLEYDTTPNNKDFKINQSQWEHSLIIYTKKICRLVCSESANQTLRRVNNKDFLVVKLTQRPSELDYIHSLGRLLELNNKVHLNFPNSLLNN
jgi:hypothetical protein